MSSAALQLFEEPEDPRWAAEARRWAAQLWDRAFLPPPRLTVDEWANRYRKLSTKETGVPGDWETARVPYLRKIMEALGPWSPACTVVFEKGAQIGGTEAEINWVGFTIDLDPGPMMAVFPTLETGRDYSRQRLDEMFRQNPELRRKVATRRSAEGGSTQLWKDFPGGMLVIVGSNSGSSLRSKPIKKLILEEVDAYEASAGQEGDPISLARMRTAAFRGRRKEFIVSTPLRAVTSRVHRESKGCEQGWQYHIPCPLCGLQQALVWERMRYEVPAAWSLEDDEGALVELPGVTYECAGCAQRIPEHQKSAMLAAGDWVALWNRGEKSVAFYLSALYSPWFSWGRCAAMYEKGKQRPEEMQVFVNTVLGLPYEEPSEAPDWEHLYGRRESYRRGVVPAGVRFLTAGVDHQEDRVEVTVVGWGREKRSWVVDHLAIPCAATLQERTRVLDELVGLDWPCAGGGTLPLWCIAVDSGAFTQDVYAWARTQLQPSFGGNAIAVRQPRTVMICKGYDRWGTPLLPPQKASAEERKRGLKIVGLGVSGLKRHLYLRLRLRPATADERAAGIEDPYGFCHFPELEEEFFRQLTAERLVRTRTRQGFEKEEWTKTRARNEALDTAVLNIGAATACGLDRFVDRDWKRIEANLPAGLLEAPSAASRTTVVLREDGVTASAVPAPAPRAPKQRRFLGLRGGYS